ncbi:MAG: amidase family protein [Actinomycetota bacterium]
MTSPYADLPVDLETAGVADVQQAMDAGTLTAEQLVLAYLNRIARYDPLVRAVRCVAPGALDEARALDAERAVTGPRGPLHGVPVLVKDNIDVAGLPTTAGSVALRDNVPGGDAVLVTLLRDAGAVILGKTNLTEFANFMAREMPSGYSSLGGQVENPYDTTITPCGSSSGSGAAAALGLATLTVGTETDGSILCPASMQGVVGVKPTVGLVSRSGIIPIAPSQDTAGPMTRSVHDAAVMLTAMAAPDDRDAATTVAARPTAVDYADRLGSVALHGLRLAVPELPDDLSKADLELFEQAKLVLEGAGVVLVPVPALVQTDELPVLLHEFGPALAAYLATVPDPPVRDLAGVVTYNRDHATIALKYGQAILEEALAVDHDGDAHSYAALRARDAAIAGEHGIDAVLAAYDVTALLVPGAEGCGVGARAGHPSVTVPAGVRTHGRRPFGVTFMAGAWSEAQLLSIAYGYEQLSKVRVPVSQANPWLVLAAELDD